jgi:NAD-dependent deacetylase
VDAQFQQARQWLHEAGAISLLTGAGISAESGLPTYRGAGGLWSGFSSQELASPEGFARDPQKVWNWHNERRMALAAVRPNAAHVALAELERQVSRRGGQFHLATQNIDGLHQAAGSRNVLELHGTILTIRCDGCQDRKPIGFEEIASVPRCSRCARPMRPDIVWFGEQLPAPVWRAAMAAAGKCEVFLTVGTSAVVYPAAGLIEVAASAGAKIIEVNLEPTSATTMADIALHAPAGEMLPQLVAQE